MGKEQRHPYHQSRTHVLLRERRQNERMCRQWQGAQYVYPKFAPSRRFLNPWVPRCSDWIVGQDSVR